MSNTDNLPQFLVVHDQGPTLPINAIIDGSEHEITTISGAIEAIEEHCQAGDYDILEICDRETVTVEAGETESRFDKHDEATQNRILTVSTEISERDDVVSSVVNRRNTNTQSHAMWHGIELHLCDEDYDITITVERNGDDPVEITENIASRYDDFTVTGWKRTRHYEKRGDRGKKVLRVFLRYDEEEYTELRSLVENVNTFKGFFSVESANYRAYFEDYEKQASHVLVTDVIHADLSLSYDENQTWEELPQIYEEQLEAHVKELDEWKILSYGTLISIDGYVVAVGVANSSGTYD